MMKTTRYALTSALPAIAAVLALSPTGALAQEAQPVTVEPTPPAAADPAPAADPLAATPEVAPVDAPAATTEASEPAPVATKTVKRSTRAAAAKPAAPARTTARTATSAAAPTPTPVADPVQAMASKPAAQPIVDMNAEQPKPAATAANEAPAKKDDTLPIAAGGALAFLALGGAAVAMTRRRRHAEEEEVWVDEEPIAEPQAFVRDEPVAEEQPLIVGPSVFAWGNERAATPAPSSTEPLVEQDDRKPGESWVERARRGPTPNNPSVSLRNRLKRAAFFDQRERDVAAGRAEPVEMDAGLPDAMVEEQEREREFA